MLLKVAQSVSFEMLPDVLRESNNMNGKKYEPPNPPGQKVNKKRETSPRSLRVFNGPLTARVDTTRLRLLYQPNII
jgi:hypothetical protein